MTCRITAGAQNSVENYIGLPSCIPLTDAEFSAVTAFFTVGGLVGSLLGTPLTERRGRRGALVVDGILIVVGCALMSLAPGMSFLLAGRFFVIFFLSFDLLGGLTFFATTIFALFFNISPGLAAIIITQSQHILTTISWGLHGYVQVEQAFNSVERVLEYIDLPSGVSQNNSVQWTKGD